MILYVLVPVLGLLSMDTKLPWWINDLGLKTQNELMEALTPKDNQPIELYLLCHREPSSTDTFHLWLGIPDYVSIVQFFQSSFLNLLWDYEILSDLPT